ncbi:MAG: ankyrin repeat domain-containing protein [Spirochaetia bacterium]|jgi:ankyrin repeat protein
MKKIATLTVALVSVVALAATAQTDGFLELVKTATALQVQEALQHGADRNARDNYGRTLLMHAAMSNRNPDVISALLI